MLRLVVVALKTQVGCSQGRRVAPPPDRLRRNGRRADARTGPGATWTTSVAVARSPRVSARAARCPPGWCRAEHGDGRGHRRGATHSRGLPAASPWSPFPARASSLPTRSQRKLADLVVDAIRSSSRSGTCPNPATERSDRPDDARPWDRPRRSAAARCGLRADRRHLCHRARRRSRGREPGPHRGRRTRPDRRHRHRPVAPRHLDRRTPRQR